MSKSRNIAAAALVLSMGTGAMAAPEYGMMVWPRLADVGPEALSGTGGIHPAVVERDAELGLVTLRSDTGTEAVVEARDGSLFAEDDMVLNAFLSEVDENLEEILQLYLAGVSEDPLCVGCTLFGRTAPTYNRDILVLLDELYMHELPAFDLTYEFTRYFAYESYEGLLEQMEQLNDFVLFLSMVDGRTLLRRYYHDGHLVEFWEYDVQVGDPNSGDRVVHNEGMDPYTYYDVDVDNDGITNSNDDNVDGDFWPNWADRDIDGDGIVNSQDPTPNGDGIIVMTTGGHDNPYPPRGHKPALAHGRFWEGDANGDGVHDSVWWGQAVEYALHSRTVALVDSPEARQLIANYTLGWGTRADVLAGLNALVLEQGWATPYTSVLFH